MSTIVVSRTTTVRRAPKKASSATQDVKPPRKARKAPAPGIMKPLKGVTEEMLAKHPISTFQNTVYALTLRIPPGYVTTYGAMAKVLNSSPRAVGQALRHNPFAPTVPWYAFPFLVRFRPCSSLLPLLTLFFLFLAIALLLRLVLEASTALSTASSWTAKSSCSDLKALLLWKTLSSLTTP